MVISSEEFEIVQELRRETHSFAYQKDQFVRDAWEGGAEIEQNDGREEFGRWVFGSVGYLLLFLGTWQICLAGGS